MDELYKEYGQLMVQAEILQKRINTVKQKINEVINKPQKDKGLANESNDRSSVKGNDEGK